MTTKAVYLDALRREIVDRYPWAQDATKLDSFMASVRRTINDLPGQKANLLTSPAAIAAYKAVGGKGKVTYKALIALPEA